LFPTAYTSVKDIARKHKRALQAERSDPAESVSQREQKGKTMPLMQILLALIVVGVLLWLVNRFIPMQGTIKSILNAVVVIGVVLWLLDAFGLFHSLSRIRIGT
jgi:Flp pilus assembly protein TadB